MFGGFPDFTAARWVSRSRIQLETTGAELVPSCRGDILKITYIDEHLKLRSEQQLFANFT